MNRTYIQYYNIDRLIIAVISSPLNMCCVYSVYDTAREHHYQLDSIQFSIMSEYVQGKRVYRKDLITQYCENKKFIAWLISLYSLKE